MRLITTLLCCLALTSCVSYGNAALEDETIARRIEKGVSTKADVAKILGDPAVVEATPEYGEAWRYMLVKSKPDPLMFVPYVGMFGGRGETETTTLVVYFDERGVVTYVGGGTGTATTQWGVFNLGEGEDPPDKPVE